MSKLTIWAHGSHACTCAASTKAEGTGRPARNVWLDLARTEAVPEGVHMNGMMAYITDPRSSIPPHFFLQPQGQSQSRAGRLREGRYTDHLEK